MSAQRGIAFWLCSRGQFCADYSTASLGGEALHWADEDGPATTTAKIRRAKAPKMSGSHDPTQGSSIQGKARRENAPHLSLQHNGQLALQTGARVISGTECKNIEGERSKERDGWKDIYIYRDVYMHIRMYIFAMVLYIYEKL